MNSNVEISGRNKPFLLKPAGKDYLWGGQRLKEEFNVEYDGDILAEA